jgi:hypothetical protein
MKGDFEHCHFEAEACTDVMSRVEELADDRWELVSVAIEPSHPPKWHAFLKRRRPLMPETH